MKIRFLALLMCLTVLLAGCGTTQAGNGGSETVGDDKNPGGVSADLGDGNKTFGETLDELGVYDGYFEGETVDVVVECVSGTKNAYSLSGSTLTFTQVSEDTVYSISGSFKGNIVIDTGDDYKFDLELKGFSQVSDTTNPITVKSGDEVAIKAKKDTKNYIYDMRSAVDFADEAIYSGAIHSEVDLEIGGKGELTVISENNNGIHTKDDLHVKNLTLFVACIDNALKGNDSVEIEGGVTTLIASGGDTIKTSNNDVSSKGNQRGTVTVTGGTHNLYAACDGIDAAYDVSVNDSATVLNIYTDKYSNYSGTVNEASKDANDFENIPSGGATTLPDGMEIPDGFFGGMGTIPDGLGIPEDFVGGFGNYPGASSTYPSDKGTRPGSQTYPSDAGGKRPSGSSSKPSGGMQGGFGGGFGGANKDKPEYSAKGIKAANEIIINDGSINIKSSDDAIHANNDVALENGITPLGNVTINGGVLTVYTNDDGLHADGTVFVKAGKVSVVNSYEGIEGSQVNISGGDIYVNANDDGINATTTSGTAISISGGTIYIYCTGDGIDSNSRTSGAGIVFTGGKTVVISNSGMNSALDTEKGYTYTAGSVIAIMPRGGMSSEATHCDNFQSIGSSSQHNLTKDEYLVVGIGEETATVKIPVSLNGLVIVLGDKSPSISTEKSTTVALDENGVAWN